ncbi:CrcB protein [Peribacillus deserti]|uniref:Fluoride-specific ion channel FluC n=1 Tax=Peribacillus deserti TaxID=673318 RepID=A0ABS2QPG8_9BACI|nr:CrcB family protein [Peribacillus deserti]MBM7694619.1 CrcB protein [Peribacillus deserti]
MWKQLVYTGAGGALGTIFRYNTQNFIGGPLGTLAANIAASFLLGYINGIILRKRYNGQAHLFWGTGVCGGFSTMSAFSADANTLFTEQSITALAYIMATIVISISAGFSGFSMGLAKQGVN